MGNVILQPEAGSDLSDPQQQNAMAGCQSEPDRSFNLIKSQFQLAPQFIHQRVLFYDFNVLFFG